RPARARMFSVMRSIRGSVASEPSRPRAQLSVPPAKTKLVGEHSEVGENVGDHVALFFGGRAVGAVVRTKERVKPIYVSQGHRVGLGQSIRIALSCCRGYRIPEPVRQAHLLVNRMRRLSLC
ncbi:MAG: endonuclease V, partial [Deltaproteobacteria bacterium]|nr:endonuclease V [Deltaproteobacteria bacterium]